MDFAALRTGLVVVPPASGCLDVVRVMVEPAELAVVVLAAVIELAAGG